MVDATADLGGHEGGRVADLESGLLHARNLIEFLTEWPGSKITAGEFLPAWKPLPAKRFDHENRVLNNWLSHLTWLRVEEDQPVPGYEWNPGPMVERVAAAFAGFAAMLPRERKDWFSGSVMVAQIKLERMSQKMTGLTATTSATDTTVRVFRTPGS